VGTLSIDHRTSIIWRLSRRSAEEAVADAPDFGFVVDVGELVYGDELGKDGEGGASSVVFELSAIELEAFVRKGELLTSDGKVLAFD
jgi:hypothetical protein